MVIPIGDAPNPRGLPLVTYALIFANVAVFVAFTVPLSAVPVDPRDPRYLAYVDGIAHSLPDPAMLPHVLRNVTEYDLFVFVHGFRPAAMTVTDLFTSMFLHGGLLHLAGNMLFLWIYGDNVEHHLGRIRYLVVYLATGAAASLSHVLLDPTSNLPMVGASGAISGVLGCYFVWFPRNDVRLLWMLPPLLMQVVLVPARIVLAFYLLLDNLLPMLVRGQTGGIAHAAHIGGFVAGAAGAWLTGRWRLGHAPVAGDDPDDVIAAAERLRARGQSRQAVATLLRFVRDHPRSPYGADLHALAGTILLEDLDDSTAAYQHFVAALEGGASESGEALARRGLAVIARLQRAPFGRTRIR
ncbi:MAG TPA: rhomboid family intramembrane serine protease [Candidatus Limnocylindria bacterium]|nr:rhomboid family intramembrane serine protease [Candidatus Limnocylindria bacterium]